MKGFLPLILGVFGTFAFSWLGLTVIPNAQIGHLDPQMDEDGNDAYPAPRSGMAERGRQIYAANGCVYCHTQQVRADYAASDIERKWGERRSAPRDYIFDRPVLLGKMRLGPDLANIGKRAPSTDENASAPGAPPAVETSGLAKNGEPLPYSAAWHHRHLYAPRSVSPDSIMPSFRFLYETRRVGGERASDALALSGSNAPAEGWEVVPSYDAQCLVAYLMSLDQSHALTEVKSTAPASAPAPGKAAK